MTVRVTSQECQGSSQYDQCSMNSTCGCFHLPSATESGICGYRWLTCSELVSCVPSTYKCFESDYICVQHPGCHHLPFCFLLSMASQEMCPTIPPSLITATSKLNCITFLRHIDIGCYYLASSSPLELEDEICLTATWAITGVTVAGGKGFGSSLDRLADPYGIFLDTNDNIYVVDRSNHRIVVWEQSVSMGQWGCWGRNGKTTVIYH